MLDNIYGCIVCCALLAGGSQCTVAAEFHVAADGIPQGTGSAEQPWDLATAFAASTVIQPGDTVWLHVGTYRGGFISQLAGKPDRPIVVRGEPGGRVIIDTHPRDDRDQGLLLFAGSDTVYRDFEVTCSHPLRETKEPGPWPADIRRGNIDIRGDRIAAVNLIVHDCSGGFGFWSEGEGGEIAGCLIYNNGWRGPDRGHGHGIYAQNAKGTKRIVDNVVFHQFGYGIHVYGSEKASLKGFEIDGNIAFENGCLSGKDDRAPGIMVGGGSAAERIAVRDNVVVAGSIRLGYPWGTTNEDIVCTGNYAEGLVIRDFRRGTIQNNTLVASSTVVSLEGADKLLLTGLKWNRNDYYVTDGRWGETSVVEHAKSRGLSFSEWQSATGLDSQSTFLKGSPTKLRITVRPNAHEAGRAHVAILNPDQLAEVPVDLSGILQRRQAFRVVSVKDYFGPSVLEGTYTGEPIRFPMKPHSPPDPVGMSGFEFPVTEPQFAAFVVLPN